MFGNIWEIYNSVLLGRITTVEIAPLLMISATAVNAVSPSLLSVESVVITSFQTRALRE
jgi:hypothetical protein